MFSIFNSEAYTYDLLLLLLVYSFGLAKKSLFGWEKIVGMLVGRIGALGTIWGSVAVEAVYEGIAALKVILGLGSVMGFTTTKCSDKHLQKDLLFSSIENLSHLNL